MGITIKYRGKAKSKQTVDVLIDELCAMAYDFGWKYDIVIEEAIKGTLIPFWGMGYGFVPSEEMIKKEHLEFFPKMVSADSTGYYKVYDSAYAEKVRVFLKDGKNPEFPIDTVQRGIWVQPHSKCEALRFLFDMKTLQLVDYTVSPDNPNVIFGMEGNYCKTQFAGFRTHVAVCDLLRWSTQFIDFTSIVDEAGYYETQDYEASQKRFSDMEQALKNFGEILKEVSDQFGLKVTMGGEK